MGKMQESLADATKQIIKLKGNKVQRYTSKTSA